jgi:hypothetical protein
VLAVAVVLLSELAPVRHVIADATIVPGAALLAGCEARGAVADEPGRQVRWRRDVRSQVVAAVKSAAANMCRPTRNAGSPVKNCT